MKKYGWCLVIYFIRMPFKTITWGIGQMRKKSINAILKCVYTVKPYFNENKRQVKLLLDSLS